MRKVLFKKWIPKVMEQFPGGSFQVPGTHCWESDFKHEGIFHQWTYAMEETSNGFGNYTVALVETSDGTIAEVLPSNLKFVDAPKSEKRLEIAVSAMQAIVAGYYGNPQPKMVFSDGSQFTPDSIINIALKYADIVIRKEKETA